MPAAAAPNSVIEAVKRYWGYETLRPLQAEAIQAGVDSRDSLVVLPTGGGKSLCYQVPPLLSGRLSIVVSPLIALMKDQVDGLRLAGYPAAALHSHLSATELDSIRREAALGSMRLLLVAPERLMTEPFLKWLDRLDGEGKLSGFAIDEAHCISQWGHDFRPEYRRLAELRERFPRLPMHAYTATATPRVRADIASQLHLRDPAVLVGCFDRPNLTYRILPKVRVEEQVAEALKRHKDRAAIVYCISRKDTETMAAALRAMGIVAKAYHAGLDGAERTRVQAEFTSEELNVVVATVAFGMGIDRGDVRCVIHASMPKSVEHYQQETGRAGRDGLEAECLLLYSAADVARWKMVMDRSAQENETSAEVVQAQHELMEHMQRLCSGARCRHRSLSEYFGQEYPRENCGACDFCLRELVEVVDGTEIARKVLSCVYRVGQAYGAAHVADVLAGKATARIKDKNHDKVSTFGLLAGLDKNEITSFINQLVDVGLLQREVGQYPTLRLGAGATTVLKGEKPVALYQAKAALERPRTARGGGSRGEPFSGPLSTEDQGLFEALRDLRRTIAQGLGVPPYVVVGDTTLQEIARVRPGSSGSLLDCRGIGQAKLAEFGERILACVREYCTLRRMKLDAERGSRPRTERANVGGVGDVGGSVGGGESGEPRCGAAYRELFTQGKGIEAVARELGVQPNTVATHLASFIVETRPASIERWVTDEFYQRVSQAAAEVGGERHKPIFDKLNAEVPYEQIRLVMKHRQAWGGGSGGGPEQARPRPRLLDQTLERQHGTFYTTAESGPRCEAGAPGAEARCCHGPPGG